MKTALDWLIEQMPYEFRANHTQELFRQAKELEKEQIMNAYCDGAKGGANGNKGQHDFGWVSRYTRKKYYNQKYNQKQHIIDIMKADEDDDLYNQIN